jgi:shikimate kinase
MAVGKSRVGRMLADRLGLAFVDSDAVIEAAKRMSIADIFKQLGEPEFRKIERKVIAGLLAGEPKVISIGGGAFIDADTRKVLNSDAITVWLDAPFEVVWQRVSRSTKRPLAAGKSADELRGLWQFRRKYYEQAQIRVETSDQPSEQVVEQILSALLPDAG